MCVVTICKIIEVCVHVYLAETITDVSIFFYSTAYMNQAVSL